MVSEISQFRLCGAAQFGGGGVLISHGIYIADTINKYKIDENTK